jgi:hypothetical protein
MIGMFGLTTSQDLLAKLRCDYQRLQKHPNNAHVAFDFFVTAEHLLDWLYPGKANKAKREQLRQQEILLQIVSHIASGAKHFDDLARHHQSVGHTGQHGGFWGASFWAPRYFSSRYWGGRRMVVTLSGQAAIALGQTITVLDLATKILNYWETQPVFR